MTSRLSLTRLDPVPAWTRLRVLNLRELRSHRLRVITSLMVITVSSMLIVAVLGTYGSLSSSVRQLSSTVSGSADLDVSAIGDSGLDESLVGTIRREVPQAATVAPLVQSSVSIDGEQVSVLGSDLSILGLGGAIRSVLTEQSGGGGGVSQSDLTSGIAVGPGLGYRVGQRVSVNGIDAEVTRVVDSDSATPINNGRFIVAFLPLAQRITQQSGRLDSILVKAAPGVDTDTLRADIERVVDGRAVVNNPDFRAKQVETASAVTRDSTLLVALISLVIAAFLVFNTMNMAVASRRKMLAMVRAIGGRRGPLVRDLIGEAALFGLVGGLIGIGFGILAGRYLIGRLPSVSAEGFGATLTYHLPWYVGPVAVLACMLACVAASVLAARSVFALSPIEAMVPGELSARDRGPGVIEWAAGVGGVALVAAGWVIAYTVEGRLVFGAAVVSSIGSLLFFFAITKPLVRAVTALASRFGGPGKLAAVNTERTPRRAWATLMTVSVAVSVGIGTSGAMNDLVGSVSGALDGLADPDLYVSSQPVENIPSGPILDSSIRDRVAAVPGVERVVGGQWATVNLGEARILMQGLAPGIQAPYVKKASPEVVQQVLDGQGIIISKVLGRALDAGVGDEIRLATPTGFHTLKILEAVDYVTLDSGTAAMSESLLAQWFQRPGNSFLQVTYAPGVDEAQVRSAVDAAATSTTGEASGAQPVYVYTGEETLDATRASVEQSGAFTIAIQWIVALVAAVALLNTLLLSVIERRRELGVLRAMGASRTFISRMVLAEAAAIAAVGSVLGVLSGELLHVISDKVLGVTTSVDIGYSPQYSTILYVVVAFGLCFVGAFLPAARAARMNISESILDE
ncbi:FtsX-like permease family protein [Williamsia phyllosphaerae]|uniref:Permease n=1 Tax=Williamsia phyllosphaerae TaxID=885042 RepID=A0ABQ1UMM6_9NOCA|nr:ABC transporter permease [Williamsia phyllosphaerae]GGF22634.1 permease [Williamsia phyllosphaerae]